ncbi:MAG: hypothetical protein NZM35_05210 [Chitinophagales bacterium]|nr:hypothetical protein [Chitinophagales bacterium]MDW8418013.1 hypothetical protein [Chitinophagales bacterium]
MCLLSGTAQLYAREISATLQADTTRIEIGDWVRVRLDVTIPKTASLRSLQIAAVGGRAELVRMLSETADTLPDVYVSHRQFIVSAYDSGIYPIGPYLITANINNRIDSLITDSILLYVSTVPVDTTQPIRPIHPVIRVPYEWREFLYWYLILGLMALMVAGFFLYMRWRKRTPADTGKRAPLRVPVYQWVRAELKKLEEEKLWQKDEVKEYYSRLSDIMRLYLEYRYGWNALEETTEEISVQIHRYEINDIAKDLLLEMLRTADLVKFAKMKPAPDTNTKCMKNAYEFVDITKPVEDKPDKKA